MEEERGEIGQELSQEKPPEENATAPVPDKEEIKAELMRVVRDLLTYLGIKAKIEVKETDEGLYANIRLRAMAGFLIGKGGRTLWALSHLANEILLKKYPNLPKIIIDVSGYRMRRVNFLKKKALAIARVVIDTKREMAFDFLTPRELRIVADALTDIKEVKIYTIGSGVRKNVIIAPNR